MIKTFVDHLSYAVGNETNTAEQAAAAGRIISDLSVLKDAGFVQHHFCSTNASAYELAHTAVERIQPHVNDIGAIIYSTCIPINGSIGSYQEFRLSRDVKHLMDFPASHLQADFDLDGASVIGLNQEACTGMLGALRVSHALLNAEPELKQVLCVTADRFPEGALYEQSYNLISDGAAACIVSLDPKGFRIVACHAETNGAMSLATDDETVGSFFSYSHSTINAILAKAGLTIKDISWIVPQNTNMKAWQILSSLLHFDFERVYFPTLPEVAHVISGDNIINLQHLATHKTLNSGERILLFMAGYGLNWQTVILESL